MGGCACRYCLLPSSQLNSPNTLNQLAVCNTILHFSLFIFHCRQSDSTKIYGKKIFQSLNIFSSKYGKLKKFSIATEVVT